MRRALLAATVTTGVAAGAAAALAPRADLLVGVLTGVGVGLVATVVAARFLHRRFASLAAELVTWTTAAPAHRAVVIHDEPEWRELGAALNAIGAALDRHRDELERDRPWRHDLVEALVNPALLFDHDGYLVAANESARELLGIASDQAPITALQALGSAVLTDAVRRARRDHTYRELDTEVRGHDVRASVSAIGDETLVIVVDRTRERRVNELRRNFVANASHELKTPATAIQTLSEALEVAALRSPDRMPDLVSRLQKESDRLVRLVHDLLNLRRLEERSEARTVDVDLVEVAGDVIADLEPRAAKRGVTVSLDADEHVTLVGDPDDLRLVVRNLLANAIQYNTDGGRVDVRIRSDAESVLLEVADTGLGIPQQDLARIFERFYRVDVARSRETGGTGLGLSIVRHAVERHGGTIRVDSLLGAGSTFTVVLPVRPSGPQ